MALRTIQQGVSDLSTIAGQILMYGGGVALFCMAVVGTFAIDLVLLAYADKKNNSFLTGWILGSMFWGPKIDPVPLLIASPITSAIAIGLSVALGVSEVGIALLIGWGVAAALIGIGYGLYALGKAMEPGPAPVTYDGPRYTFYDSTRPNAGTSSASPAYDEPPPYPADTGYEGGYAYK